MTQLFETSETIGRLAGQIGPSIVGIGPGWRGGSGVVLEPGRVLTAAHNLRGDRPGVVFADGRTARAEVTGVDHDLGLAVVEVDTGDTPAVEAAGGDPLGIGAFVVGAARPGGRALRVTAGFVSAEQRRVRGPRGRRVAAIEHTAPLPRGSSGGPLVDAEGRLVGINVIRLEGGLIVAVDTVAAAADIARLSAGEAPKRRRLGVAVAPPRVARRLRGAVGLPDRSGILVRAVEDDSPAAKAGIERGDLLVGAGGQPLEEIDDLYALLDAPDTDSIELTVLHGSDERTVTVELGSEQ